jgi:hypothetical protein
MGNEERRVKKEEGGNEAGGRGEPGFFLRGAARQELSEMAQSQRK